MVVTAEVGCMFTLSSFSVCRVGSGESHVKGHLAPLMVACWMAVWQVVAARGREGKGVRAGGGGGWQGGCERKGERGGGTREDWVKRGVRPTRGCESD